MPTLGPTARKVLGLPDPGDWEAKKARRKTKKTPASDPVALPVQASAVNPWESAAEALKAQQQRAVTPSAPASTPSPARETGAPWSTIDEKSGSAALRRLGRGVLWAVVGLAVITGVRAWVVPNQTTTDNDPPPAKTAPAYPSDAAQAVAARFARAYLAWDADAPAARASMLAAVLPEGADTEMGWDGQGQQEVLAVQPGAVTPT
ncbi:hypothetical protein KBZ94_42130, partial [Streptomyces sp. RM72]|nr:hypothetical protein [Streptomyces sp. RM72]